MINNWIPILYPKSITSFPREKGKLFFSFDDGPTPEITPWVLQTLEQYQAKATFFCLGQQVEKYPDLYQTILEKGHAVGNHSYSHIRGLYAATNQYIDDVNKAQQLIASPLFRPPYGSLMPMQYLILSKKYNVVFWDVMAYDFNAKLKPEQCLKKVTRQATDGSVIVFHDTQKAYNNLKYVLPKALEHFAHLGFEFAKIEL